jgi:hypothetical protein
MLVISDFGVFVGFLEEEDGVAGGGFGGMFG